MNGFSNYQAYGGPTLRGTAGQGGGMPQIPGFGPMGNALFGMAAQMWGPSRNIAQLVTTQSPFERMYGMAYTAEVNRMSGTDSANASKALHDYLAESDKAKRAAMMQSPAARANLYSGAQTVGAMMGIRNLADYIPGLEAQGAGGGVLQGMQYMQGAGLLPAGGPAAAKFSQQMAGAGLNLMPSEQGTMFAELGRRGMLPGRMGDMQSGKTRAIAANIKQWDKTLSGMKDIFGDQGIPALLDKLDQITQGGLQRASPARMNRIVNSMKYLSASAGVSADSMYTMAATGAHQARALGIAPTIGAQAALTAYGVGDAMARMSSAAGDMSWNEFGTRSADEYSGIFTQRALLGQASRASVASGGLLGMVARRARAGGMSGKFGTLASSVSALGGSNELRSMVARLEAGDASAIQSLNSGSFGGAADMLESIGVNRAAAFSAMRTQWSGQQEMSGNMGAGIMRAQTAAFIESMAPRIKGQVTSMRLSNSDITGALSSLQGLDDLSPAAMQRHLTKYLGSSSAAAELSDAANLIADRSGLGGLRGIFSAQKAAAAAAAKQSAFAELDPIATKMGGIFRTDKLAKGALMALFSGDEGQTGMLDFLKGKSKSAATAVQSISKQMPSLEKVMMALQRDPNNAALLRRKAAIKAGIKSSFDSMSADDKTLMGEAALAEAGEGKSAKIIAKDVNITMTNGNLNVSNEASKTGSTKQTREEREVVKFDADTGRLVGQERGHGSSLNWY